MNFIPASCLHFPQPKKQKADSQAGFIRRSTPHAYNTFKI
ncbi:hypothetical protein AT05_11175 [Schleiferia thermophila str. Yellowstone]|nr:hypothetical protein AT05_11175 [Schleiferia thermophila str. Yellowstone]